MTEDKDRIRLRFMPWIARKLGYDNSKWLTLEEEWREGLTVRGLLELLAERYPEFGKAAYDKGEAKLTGQITITLNGLFLELRGGLDGALEPGDEIVFLAAFAGG